MEADLIPLRYLARVLVSNVDKRSVDGEQVIRLVNYTDVYYNDRITPDLPLMRATASSDQVARFRLQTGDSIITKDSETAEDIAIASHIAAAAPDMVSGYHLAIVRPRPRTEARYLTWALRSEFVRGQYAVAANGMTRYGLTYDAIESARVPLPDVAVQRRIADFLDDQVARIDNIIAARGTQLLAIDQALTSQLVEIFGGADTVMLRRLVRDAVVGIVVQPAKYYVDDSQRGVPAIRGTNVSEDGISMVDLVRISEEGHRLHPRSHLQAKDVVVVRTGDAGSACVVPDWAVGWNCIDLVIVRANAETSPHYVAHALNAARRDTSITAAASGSIQQHFGVGAILNLPVRRRSFNEQLLAVEAADGSRGVADAGSHLIEESIAKLNEFKRSLITAAVTGEFDVSTADGSRVPA